MLIPSQTDLNYRRPCEFVVQVGKVTAPGVTICWYAKASALLLAEVATPAELTPAKPRGVLSVRVGMLLPASFSITNDTAMSPALLVVTPDGVKVVLPAVLTEQHRRHAIQRSRCVDVTERRDLSCPSVAHIGTGRCD